MCATPRVSRAAWIEATRSRAAWRASVSGSGWRTSWTDMGSLGWLSGQRTGPLCEDLLGQQRRGRLERRPVGRVAQQRLSDALAQDPGLAARGAEDGPVALFPTAVLEVRAQAARTAVQRVGPARGGGQRQAGEAADLLARVGLQAHLDVLAAGGDVALDDAAALAHQRV